MSDATVTRKYTKWVAASCLAAGLCFTDKGEAEAMAAAVGNIFEPVEYQGWWYLRKDRGQGTPLWLVSVE